MRIRVWLLLLFITASTGCVSFPDDAGTLSSDFAYLELTETPFFPQQRFQCGPAALATVLQMSGLDTTPDELIEAVYLPKRQGSLAIELRAATRNAGRLPYLLDPSIDAIARELSAGRPVLVLQNLGVRLIPKWHFAVVVGLDPSGRTVLLRSGTDRLRATSIRTFMHTWSRSQFWAMVALRPDEIPANVDRLRYFTTISDLEQVGQTSVALGAWRQALTVWPDDTIALFGLANVHYSLAEYAKAEQQYRRLLGLAPDMIAARNNLAMTLMHRQNFDTALKQIELALTSTQDPELSAELSNTRDLILAAMEQDCQHGASQDRKHCHQ